MVQLLHGISTSQLVAGHLLGAPAYLLRTFVRAQRQRGREMAVDFQQSVLVFSY
jgi:hypothetical protein